MRCTLENKETQRVFWVILSKFGQATFTSFFIKEIVFLWISKKAKIHLSYNIMASSKWFLEIVMKRKDGFIDRFYKTSSVYSISGDIAVPAKRNLLIGIYLYVLRILFLTLSPKSWDHMWLALTIRIYGMLSVLLVPQLT